MLKNKEIAVVISIIFPPTLLALIKILFHTQQYGPF
jgi:hypothetical protein